MIAAIALAGLVATVPPPDYDTALADAVSNCGGEEEALVQEEDGALIIVGGYQILDEGHSVVTFSSEEGFGCLVNELGFPQWVGQQVELSESGPSLWTTVAVDGYTITWSGIDVIVYDEEVGGGS